MLVIPLLVFLLAVLAQAPGELDIAPARVWLAVAMVTLSPIVLAVLQTIESQRLGQMPGPAERHRQVARHRELTFLGAWGCASLAGVWLMRWPAWVEDWLPRGSWPFLHPLVLILPALVSLLGSWIATDIVRKWLGADPLERESASATGFQKSRRLLMFALLPFLVAMGLEASLSLWPATRSAWILTGGMVVAATVLLFPLYLRWALKSTRLQAAWCRDELNSWHIRVWNTGCSIYNAMLAGTTPLWRTIYVSDGLMMIFSEAEVQAIVRHEVAHAQRWHVPARTAVLVLPFGFGGWSAASGLHLTGFSACLFAVGAAILTVVYLRVVVKRVSHWIEFDADRASIGAPGAPGQVSVQRLSELWSALDRLAQVFPEMRHRATLFHPSLGDRLARLDRLRNRIFIEQNRQKP